MSWALGLLPFVMLLLGMPIFAILLVSGAVAMIFVLGIPEAAIHQAMFGSIEKYALLAVPFFLFAGDVMGQGGLSKRIVVWALSLFGPVRGSLGYSTLATNVVFGAISGSSAATVAATGRLLYPSLRRHGYSEKFSLGLITASGAIDSLIPPSILMILYGLVAEQSVAHLFAAGVLPGLVMAGFFGICVFIYTWQAGISEGARFSFGGFLAATRDGIWALGAPVVILGGIYGGVFTPTEAAGVACLYAVVVSRFVYREIGWAELWKLAIRTTYLTAQIFLILAAAGVFSWVLTVSGIPQAVVAAMQSYQMSPATLLLAINVLLLIVGCFLDTASAILILTPLLVPIAKAAGIDLIHFGIVVTVNLAIGMYTPPFGLNIFVSQAIFNAPLRTIYAGLVPFIIASFGVLAVVTYVPELSLALTRFVK